VQTQDWVGIGIQEEVVGRVVVDVDLARVVVEVQV
jgi:hypothetical protein